ncbi:GNAT family N-acetyltransferase [Chloroflexota bacterium]
MSYTITRESFDSLASYRADSGNHLIWGSPFVLPAWMKTWWQEFGGGEELYLGAIRQGEQIAGIAPLLIREKTASIIGSADVCDYLDFIIAPGMERDFFTALLDDLGRKGVNHLDLGPLRPDSTVLTHLVPMTRERSYQVTCQPEDVSFELDLPASWDEYLATLTKKQRHEVRRKLRRLWEAGDVNYHCYDASQPGDLMDTFLKLFTLSREDKADFMTARMELFFRALVKAMAEIGLLRFGVLELNTQPTAMIMGFDYNNSMYLYNSGYDPQYNSLSVGLLCKVLCIQKSIEESKKRFDFLKGDEIYKYHLGGREIPISRCQITIK